MTCPQCGALIKKISLKEEFADCDYCEAKILLEANKDKIVEIPEQKSSAWEQYRENYRKINERTRQLNEPYMSPQEPEADSSNVAGIIVILIVGFLIFGGLIALFSTGKSSPKVAKLPTQTPITSDSPIFSYKTPTPVKRINYQVKVQWTGGNDMEHFENPLLKNEKLPTLDENELKKTVFKNRTVQVRITINTDGEVSSAEGISGHPILQESAVEAAKKTLFNPRQKPTTRILTYYFRLITD